MKLKQFFTENAPLISAIFIGLLVIGFVGQSSQTINKEVFSPQTGTAPSISVPPDFDYDHIYSEGSNNFFYDSKNGNYRVYNINNDGTLGNVVKSGTIVGASKPLNNQETDELAKVIISGIKNTGSASVIEKVPSTPGFAPTGLKTLALNSIDTSVAYNSLTPDQKAALSVYTINNEADYNNLVDYKKSNPAAETQTSSTTSPNTPASATAEGTAKEIVNIIKKSDTPKEQYYNQLSDLAKSTKSKELSRELYTQAALLAETPADKQTAYKNAADSYNSLGSAYASNYYSSLSSYFQSGGTLAGSGLNEDDINNLNERQADLEQQLSNQEKGKENPAKKTELQKLTTLNNLAYLNQPTFFETTGATKWLLDHMKYVEGVNAYPGITSALYSEELDLYNKIDEHTANWLLGGAEGWASELCRMDVMDDEYGADAGYAFSESANGASAHIEGEVIPIKKVDNESNIVQTNIYKISFQVNPGTSYAGCDIKFTAWLKGQNGKTPLIVGNSSRKAKTLNVDRGDQPISYTGENMIAKETANEYSQACLSFSEIVPRSGRNCLIGIDEGDELCSDIIEGEEKVYTDFECTYCSMTESIFGLGGGSTRTPQSNSQSGNGGTSPSGSADDSAVVNPDI